MWMLLDMNSRVQELMFGFYVVNVRLNNEDITNWHFLCCVAHQYCLSSNPTITHLRSQKGTRRRTNWLNELFTLFVSTLGEVVVYFLFPVLQALLVSSFTGTLQINTHFLSEGVTPCNNTHTVELCVYSFSHGLALTVATSRQRELPQHLQQQKHTTIKGTF